MKALSLIFTIAAFLGILAFAVSTLTFV